MEVTIYGDPIGKLDRSNDKPPTERYIHIMTEGAEYYGVDPEYIEWLNSHENQPRPTKENLGKWEVPEGAPTYSKKQVEDMCDVNDLKKIYIIMNGKILHYQGDKPSQIS